MRRTFDWFDRLSAAGKSGLGWLILSAIAVGLSSLYLVFDTNGAIAAAAISFALLLLRIVYPNRQPAQKPSLPQYICCAPVIWINEKDEEYECWFHLYEHPDQRREAVYTPCSMQRSRDPQALGQKHILYNKVILPWMHHVYSNDAVTDYFAQPRRPKVTPTAKPTEADTKAAKSSKKIITLDQFRPK